VAILASDPEMPDLSQGVLSQLKQAAALGRMDFFATRVNSGGYKAGGHKAGRDEGMTRVASEAAAQFVMACKSGAKHKSPHAARAPAETSGTWNRKFRREQSIRRERIDAVSKPHRRSRVPSWKRILDCTLILAATPAWLPLGALIAAWVKLVSSGPVLFRQERIGHLGARFCCSSSAR